MGKRFVAIMSVSVISPVDESEDEEAAIESNNIKESRIKRKWAKIESQGQEENYEALRANSIGHGASLTCVPALWWPISPLMTMSKTSRNWRAEAET